LKNRTFLQMLFPYRLLSVDPR